MKLLNLASNNSFRRGIDYHHENRVISWDELEKNCYKGKVKGSGSAVYDSDNDKDKVLLQNGSIIFCGRIFMQDAI